MHSIQSANASCATEPRGMLPSRETSAVIAAASGAIVCEPSSLIAKRNGNPHAAMSPPVGSRMSISLTSLPCAWIGLVRVTIN
jgi:hypothetical protein